MRISQEEALSIRETIQARDPSATVSLFGSMADDHARGGDIDLVIDNGRPSAFVRSIESRAIRL